MSWFTYTCFFLAYMGDYSIYMHVELCCYFSFLDCSHVRVNYFCLFVGCYCLYLACNKIVWYWLFFLRVVSTLCRMPLLQFYYLLVQVLLIAIDWQYYVFLIVINLMFIIYYFMIGFIIFLFFIIVLFWTFSLILLTSLLINYIFLYFPPRFPPHHTQINTTTN